MSGKKRPAHHPPVAGDVRRPSSATPGYVYGHLSVAGFGCRDFYVAQIPRKVAVEIIRRHHYSGRIVQNSYVHLGVFLDGERVGVLQFGYALNSRRASVVVAGTSLVGYLELNRMWLSDVAPANSESRAISYAIKYIRRAMPQVGWIQSFADERCGGLGVVYQACNFVYLGEHKTRFYELDGEFYHEIIASKTKDRSARRMHLLANMDRATVRWFRQFRYVFFVKPRCRRYLKMRVRPYPKRDA